MNQLDHYFVIARAIVALFQPLVEVAIHNTRTGKIIFIEGGLSKRSVGDPSLLDAELNEIEQEVYVKMNFDGRVFKSISIPIRENNSIIALICINYDTSLFEKINKLTSVLVHKKVYKRPESLFRKDWNNQINEFIAIELEKKGMRFTDLKNKDKQDMVYCLFKSGAFSEKNAADYIAKVMDMGRATIFNYLRKFKKDNHAV